MENTPFASTKFTHVHNRGFENRVIFSSEEDFNRFEAYLYLLNAVESPRVSNIFAKGRTPNVFEHARGEQLVAIASYSFTPKEFHILIAPRTENAIAKFMQKLQTAYTMYFNFKYQRSGILFQSSYRARNAKNEDDLKQLHAYVHLHPTTLFNPDWELLDARDLEKIAVSAMHYKYSSVGEYINAEYRIVTPENLPLCLRRNNASRSYIKVWSESRKGESQKRVR